MMPTTFERSPIELANPYVDHWPLISGEDSYSNEVGTFFVLDKHWLYDEFWYHLTDGWEELVDGRPEWPDLSPYQKNDAALHYLLVELTEGLYRAAFEEGDRKFKAPRVSPSEDDQYEPWASQCVDYIFYAFEDRPKEIEMAAVVIAKMKDHGPKLVAPSSHTVQED